MPYSDCDLKTTTKKHQRNEQFIVRKNEASRHHFIHNFYILKEFMSLKTFISMSQDSVFVVVSIFHFLFDSFGAAFTDGIIY